MSQPIELVSIAMDSFPRTRGDEPELTTMGARSVLFSPHARG